MGQIKNIRLHIVTDIKKKGTRERTIQSIIDQEWMM